MSVSLLTTKIPTDERAPDAVQKWSGPRCASLRRNGRRGWSIPINGRTAGESGSGGPARPGAGVSRLRQRPRPPSRAPRRPSLAAAVESVKHQQQSTRQPKPYQWRYNAHRDGRSMLNRRLNFCSSPACRPACPSGLNTHPRQLPTQTPGMRLADHGRDGRRACCFRSPVSPHNCDSDRGSRHSLAATRRGSASTTADAPHGLHWGFQRGNWQNSSCDVVRPFSTRERKGGRTNGRPKFSFPAPATTGQDRSVSRQCCAVMLVMQPPRLARLFFDGLLSRRYRV